MYVCSISNKNLNPNTCHERFLEKWFAVWSDSKKPSQWENQMQKCQINFAGSRW